MSSYIKILGEAVAPGMATQATNLVTAPFAAPPKAKEKSPIDIKNVALGAGAGYVGYRVWKKHPVLGALVGASAGFHALNIAKGDEALRKDALIGLGVIGVGTGASLVWKRHPAWGYLLGAGAASIASAFIPGSPIEHLVAEMRLKHKNEEQAKRLGLPATAGALPATSASAMPAATMPAARAA